MIGYTLRRIILLVPTLLGVFIMVSSVLYVIPGDPVDQLLGPLASESDKESLREILGIHQHYLVYIKQKLWEILHFDLGTSLIYQRSVYDMIAERIPLTLLLSIFAFSLSISLGLTLGFISAYYEDTFIDRLASTFAILALAIPNFWLGPLLVYIFSLKLNLLPVSGYDSFWHILLPGLTLGLSLAAVMARMTRTTLLENLRQNYALVAKAKGVHHTRVILKHVLRNSALAILTVAGLQLGVLLGGAIITEHIFDWPGLGTLLLDGINSRDYPLVQGCVLVIALCYVIVNLLVDLIYAIIDPRITFH